MSFLVSILIIALDKNFHNSSFYERLGDALWPICVIVALVIILGMIIEQWRTRRG